MLIREDYFKDIDITDDDITSSTTEQSNEPDNTDSLFNTMLSNYTHCISILVYSSKSIFKNKKLWQDSIPRIIKRLYTLLDLYGIEHSEPILIDNNVARIAGDDLSNYKISHYYNNKIAISTNKDLTQDYLTTSLNLTIYINLPKFTTYKQPYKFIYDILKKGVWKNNNEKEYRYFMLLSTCDSLAYIKKVPHLHIDITEIINTKDNKKLMPITIYNILVNFFPTKSSDIWNMYDDAVMKRNNDLYNCIQ